MAFRLRKIYIHTVYSGDLNNNETVFLFFKVKQKAASFSIVKCSTLHIIIIALHCPSSQGKCLAYTSVVEDSCWDKVSDESYQP